MLLARRALCRICRHRSGVSALSNRATLYPRLIKPTLPFATAAAALISFSVLNLFVDSAWSQTARAIRVIVPFPAAGPSDIVARLLAEQVGSAQGRTIIVEESPRGRHGNRYKFGFASRTRRQHPPTHHGCVTLHSADAYGQISSVDQLRADLSSGRFANLRRGQQRFSVPNACRFV